MAQVRLRKIENKCVVTKIGYESHMIFVNTSLDVALERNEKRPRKLEESCCAVLE